MRRIVPIFLVGIGLALFFGAAGWVYFNNLVAHPAAVTLPERVAGLAMTEYKTGAQAAADFTNLHGRQFPIASGAIGIYGEDQITLWAAGAPVDFIATRMLDAMQEKIAEGNSPFTPLPELNDSSRTVYVLEGMGQKHFYFQSQNLIIWLAADPTIADQAIQQILEVYP